MAEFGGCNQIGSKFKRHAGREWHGALVRRSAWINLLASTLESHAFATFMAESASSIGSVPELVPASTVNEKQDTHDE